LEITQTGIILTCHINEGSKRMSMTRRASAMFACPWTQVVKMPCSKAHVFCRECVAEWLARDDSCPMCRVALPVWLGRPQYA
jgi:hypothetical protein